MGTAVALTIAATLAGIAVVLADGRARAAAMLAALAMVPVLLIGHVGGSDQLDPLTSRPALVAAAALAGAVLVAGLALAFDRHPRLLPLAAVATLPFRIPIASGDSTSNLLVPLYLVIGAGVLAYAVPRLRGDRSTASGGAGGDAWRPGALEWLLALAVVLYAAQTAYSDDTGKALENAIFFYVPFALLFALLARMPWDRRLALQCLGLLVVLSLAFAAIGGVEYATRHILLNPKVIASNQFESYFRVNSLFFDPNIYGRFLATVMVFVAAALLWARRALAVTGAVVTLALLWGGLLLTFSQTSFAALLIGLAVLAGLRWRPRLALGAGAALALVALAVAIASPGSVGLDDSADSATSGRVDLVEGGARLFTDRPVAGYGSGSFSRAYRRAENASGQRAVSASHTIPVTIAAEQGAIGLLAYLALVAAALARLLRGASRDGVRAALAAAFAALLLHTLGYAAFLEDPITWVLLAAGSALAAGTGVAADRSQARAVAPEDG